MQRASASPRAPDSPSKRTPSLLTQLGLGDATQHGSKAAQAGAPGYSRVIALLALGSLLVNVAVIFLLVTRCNKECPSCQDALAANLNAHSPTVLATQQTAATSEMQALHQKELSTLRETVDLLRLEKTEALESEKAAMARAAAALDDRSMLSRKVEELKAAVAAGGGSSRDEDRSVVPSASGDCPCRQQSRLSSDDIALQGAKFDLTTHEVEWKCDDQVWRPH
jgi:hypothetical protein